MLVWAGDDGISDLSARPDQMEGTLSGVLGDVDSKDSLLSYLLEWYCTQCQQLNTHATSETKEFRHLRKYCHNIA